jgi:hypothetical protein
MPLREADERQERRAREDPPADPSEDLERAERELARIRREPSPAVTDTEMSVAAGNEEVK